MRICQNCHSPINEQELQCPRCGVVLGQLFCSHCNAPLDLRYGYCLTCHQPYSLPYKHLYEMKSLSSQVSKRRNEYAQNPFNKEISNHPQKLETNTPDNPRMSRRLNHPRHSNNENSIEPEANNYQNSYISERSNQKVHPAEHQNKIFENTTGRRENAVLGDNRLATRIKIWATMVMILFGALALILLAFLLNPTPPMYSDFIGEYLLLDFLIVCFLFGLLNVTRKCKIDNTKKPNKLKQFLFSMKIENSKFLSKKDKRVIPIKLLFVMMSIFISLLPIMVVGINVTTAISDRNWDQYLWEIQLSATPAPTATPLESGLIPSTGYGGWAFNMTLEELREKIIDFQSGIAEENMLLTIRNEGWVDTESVSGADYRSLYPEMFMNNESLYSLVGYQTYNPNNTSVVYAFVAHTDESGKILRLTYTTPGNSSAHFGDVSYDYFLKELPYRSFSFLTRDSVSYIDWIHKKLLNEAGEILKDYLDTDIQSTYEKPSYMSGYIEYSFNYDENINFTFSIRPIVN